jgi:Na+-driven multidrug efflux pump
MGQNFGAKKWKRIHKGFKISAIVMASWGIVVTLILFFGGGFIFSLFLPGEPDVIAIGADYLRILAISQALSCIEAICAGTFRGLGRTTPPSISSATCNFLRVLLAYYLSRTAMGLDGIWWALTLGAIGRGVWMFVWFMAYSKKLPKEDEVLV